MSAQPTVPTDLSADRLEDFRCRDRADAMGFALQRYRQFRHSASVASVVAENTGDPADARDAELHRADAKAALCTHPELLSLVEGKP